MHELCSGSNLWIGESKNHLKIELRIRSDLGERSMSIGTCKIKNPLKIDLRIRSDLGERSVSIGTRESKNHLRIEI